MAPRKNQQPPHKPLPGDIPMATLRRRMLRVNQAGEFGAQQIYKGQLAVLADRPSGPVIAEMAEQEAAHLRTFNHMMAASQVRPTALTPLWRVAGFALGAGTALLGEKAAMACTVAVEDEIDAHYQRQNDLLQTRGDAEDEDLRATIEKFRQEELEHRDTALDHGAERTPGYRLLHRAIRSGTRLAIRLSERI